MVELFLPEKKLCTNFTNLQEAINAMPATDELCVLRIAPGIYREKIVLQRSNTVLEGMGQLPEDTELTYDDFAFDIMPEGDNRGTFRSYSFFLDASNVTLKNLTISNTSGDEKKVGQAIALYAEGERIILDNCRLLGRQDTLFTGPLPPKELQPGGFKGPKQFAPRINGRQLYRNCYICGNVDFIFGSATAYFENCIIESLSHDDSSPIQGYVTAPSTPEGQEYGYVFKDCKLISSECKEGSVYLGRPWRDYGKTVFLSCEFGSHINAEGFHDWGKEHAREVAFLGTYDCTQNGRPFQPTAVFTKKLDADALIHYSRENVLGF